MSGSFSPLFPSPPSHVLLRVSLRVPRLVDEEVVDGTEDAAEGRRETLRLQKPQLLYLFEEITILTKDFCLLFGCKMDMLVRLSAAERSALVLALSSRARVLCWPWRA